MGKKTQKKAAKALEEVDAAVVEGVEPYAETQLVRAISLLSEVGDQPPMRTLCAATIAAGLAGGNARLTRAGIRMLAAHTVATLAKDALKVRIDRSRPRKDRNHGLKPGRSTGKEDTSFPSGHSAGAIAVARAYAREYPEHRHFALAAAGAVALAQIPRCAHYPTDVGVGLAVGLVSEALVELPLDPLFQSLPTADWLPEAFRLSDEDEEE